MIITFDLSGRDRKQLVKAISEITGARAVYKFMPTCAYEIDFFTVTKEGTLEFPDRSDTEIVEQVLDGLAEKGFTMTSAINENGHSDMFGAKDSAKNGLELAFDKELRGTNGLMHRRKVLNKYMDIPVLNPIDGADIVTTIDVGMQDLAEQALIDELKDPRVHGEMGVAILMEVKTGDVKAIVNMQRAADGEYYEMVNNAISYRCEPGSVFKVASFLVALDDGWTAEPKRLRICERGGRLRISVSARTGAYTA